MDGKFLGPDVGIVEFGIVESGVVELQVVELQKMASNKKVANVLVAASCAAVLAVYTAGYNRTRSAVEQFEAQAAQRRAADPVPERLEAPMPERLRPPAPEPPAIAALPKANAAAVPRSAVSAEPGPQKQQDGAVEQPRAEIAASPAIASVVIPDSAPVELSPNADAVATHPEVARQPPVEHKPEEAVAAAPNPAPKWKDGTYYGWGTSRHGDIQAQVVVQGGRISATISDCRTRYPCSVIEMLPPQVAQRQSPDVDYVSRATQSANAFYFAVVDALSKAK